MAWAVHDHQTIGATAARHLGRGQMGKGRASLAWIAAAVIWAGCAGAQRPAEFDEPAGPYRIGSEDVVEVAVYHAPELSRTLPVRPDGRISLPLLGEVEAAGRTAAELADELRDRLDGLIQSPRVTVIIREVNAARIYVIGEVAHPGAFHIRGELDALQALALAGGLGDFAARSRIVLIRKGSQGESRMTIDYEKLVRDSNAKVPKLRPGDTIYVP